MLEVRGINQFYGESHILWDLTLNAEEGLCTCLMGRNGVGKTSLLKVVMGLLTARQGEIYFNKNEISSLSPAARAKLGLGYVPQGREIFSQLTVEENLRVAIAAAGSQDRTIPGLVYELFPVLEEMKGRRGGDLSGGQQQQLAIGRALVTRPTLLMLDEPTEGIQPNIVTQIANVLKRLNEEEKISILLVEQKLAFAKRVAHRYCIMQKGSNVSEGPITDLNQQLIDQYLTV